jgi:hypothetical protein
MLLSVLFDKANRNKHHPRGSYQPRKHANVKTFIRRLQLKCSPTTPPLHHLYSDSMPEADLPRLVIPVSKPWQCNWNLTEIPKIQKGS